MDKFLLKAAEEALSGAFQIGSESTNVEMKNAFFRFAENVVTYLVLKGALDVVFDRNVAK